jgi:hypothetical protein
MDHRRALPPESLVAMNSAASSGNPFHTDEGARAAGYERAVIGGLTTYGYLCSYPLREWGAGWLERGGIDVRLRVPIVDQQPLQLSAEMVSAEIRARVDAISETQFDSMAQLPNLGPLALAVAWLGGPGPLPPWSFPVTPPAAKLSPDQLATSQINSLPSMKFTPDVAWCSATLLSTQADACDLGVLTGEVSKGDPLPPSVIIDMANLALMNALDLGTWLHTRSKTQHFTQLRCGDEIEVRTRVLSTEPGELGLVSVFELAFLRGQNVCARVEHSAIFTEGALANGPKDRL